MVAKVTNNGTTATDFHVRITTPTGVRVTTHDRQAQTVTGQSTTPLAPGTTATTRFTLVGDHSLTGEVTVTVGVGDNGPTSDTRTTTLNVTAARHAPTTPRPQGAVVHEPFTDSFTPAPAKVTPATDDTSRVITTVLAAVITAASAALVVVLRRRVDRR